jgi:hypothetical protein
MAVRSRTLPEVRSLRGIARRLGVGLAAAGVLATACAKPTPYEPGVRITPP